MIKSQIELGKEYFMYQRMKGITEIPHSIAKIRNESDNNNSVGIDDNETLVSGDLGLKIVQSPDLLTEKDLLHVRSMPSKIEERASRYIELGIRLN